jgi:AraC-like DNA-binding protein
MRIDEGFMLIHVKKNQTIFYIIKSKDGRMTLEQVKHIQNVQDYIEDHLDQPMTLAELSKVAGYSPSQTERLFQEMTGEVLFHYIRKLRLTAAAKHLKKHKDLKIIDVSLDYLFDSHEGFTRAFSKYFGLSPKKYQQNPIPVRFFNAYDVLGQYQLLQKKIKEEKENMNSKTVFVQVIERPKRKAMIKRGIKADEYFQYCEEVGCDVWGILESVPNALYEPVGFWLPKSLKKPHTSTYVQGVELPEDYQGVIPEGFELIDLEPSLVMIFQGEPYKDEDFMDAIGDVWKHIEQFDPKLYGYTFDDSQPRFQMEPRGYRGYIEGRPVKKI